MKKLFLLLLLFTTTACAQVLIDGVSGFSNKRIFLGLNGGGIEYDKDSSAYKLFYENKLGSLDSAWIVISSRASTPWAVNLEAQQRADADGNLLAQILLKASVVSVDSLRNRMTNAESSILLKASRLEVDGLRDSVWAEIVLKASIASVNALANSLENAEAAIQLKADKVYVDSLGLVYVSLINLKANVNSVDTLRNRMNSAEASILLKANQTYVEELGTSLSSQIALKASILVADTLKNRMTTAEAGISANASALVGLDGEVSNVVASLLLYAKKDSVISYINISPGIIKISASKIELDGTAIADSLFGQVIIAPVIRTSASGAGIVLNGATNQIEFLNSAGAVVGVLSSSTGGTPTVTGGALASSVVGDFSTDGSDPITIGTDANGGLITLWKNGSTNYLRMITDGAIDRLSTPPLSVGDLSVSQISKWGNKIVDAPSAGYLHYNGAQFVWDTPGTGNWTAPSVNTIGTGLEVVNGVIAINFVPITTETDPNVSAWAKASSKPSYTYSEVGADVSGAASTAVLAHETAYVHSSFLTTETDPNVPSHVKSITSQNITDWNWASGVVDALHNIAISGSYNDLNNVPASFTPAAHGNEAHSSTFLVTETDPTIYAWAKAATKPSYTYSEVGAQVAGTYVTTETDPNVPSHVKSITSQNITDWNWASAVVDVLHTVATSGSYTDLINKPTITNVAWGSTDSYYLSDIDYYVETIELVIGTTTHTVVTGITR